MKKIIAMILLITVSVYSQTARPGRTPRWDRLVSWILNGQETLTYKSLTSPTLTGTISITGSSALNLGSAALPLAITTTPSFTIHDSTLYASTGYVRSATINLEQDADTWTSKIEAFRVNVESEYITGDWTNAIVARIDYGTNGDARGGMVAPLCSELNYPGKACAGVGGAYYVLDLEMNCPTNFTVGTNLSYPNAWVNFGIWGDATAISSWEDYGFILRFDGFTSATGNVIYNNTIRSRISSTSWYIPLSDAEGEYSSAYLIDISNATDASNLTTASIATDGGLAVTKQLYLGDDLDMSVSTTGVYDITLNDAQADALSIVRGSTDMMVFDTNTPLITITPATTITGLLTANGSVAVGDGDYIGITSNEIITFNAAGTIVASGADVHVGGTAADNVAPALKIVSDADSDGAQTTSETMTIDLTPNATPTSAVWDITSTQSTGYRVDKSFTVGIATPDETTPTLAVRGDADSDAGGDTTDEFALTLTANATPTSAVWDITSTQSAGYRVDKSFTVGLATPDETTPTLAVRADADSDADDTTDELAIVLTANATPTAATWGFTSTQSAGYTFDKAIDVTGLITSSVGLAVGDEDYVGVTSNERFTFQTAGSIKALLANLIVGQDTPDEHEPYFAIRADADSDADDTTDEFRIFLTANATPTAATWGFTSTQSAGYTFDKAIDVTGLITSSVGLALDDGDYVGVTANERFTFQTGGSITATGANLIVGAAVADEVRPTFSIVGDADSDGTATSETLTYTLTANTDPTAAMWHLTSTQSAGYRFDKTLIVGIATPDENEPYISIRADADSDADDTTDEFKIAITANATPTSATWGFTSTQSAGYTFDKAVDVTGLLTSSVGLALGDGDYVGVTANERFTFATGGTIAAVGANFDIGTTSADEATPALTIRADADSDAEDTDEALTIDLTANSTPTSAVWDVTSTQSAGYRFDKSFTVGLATPDETTPTLAIRADADSDADDTTDELAIVLTANATPTNATWGFTSTQSAGYTFDKAIDVTGLITSSTGLALGDGDYVGVTGNEIVTFATGGTVAIEGANFNVGETAADNVTRTFNIIGDADSDGAQTTSETLTITLNTDATPTNSTWDITSTQGTGYIFDKTVAFTNIDVDGTSDLDNTDIDGTFTMDGTAFDVNSTTTVTIDNTNTGNGVVINAATSGSPVSIGHTTSETTVNDNLNITGTLNASGTLTIGNDVNVTVPTNGGNAGAQNTIQGVPKIDLQGTGQLAGTETVEYMDDSPSGEWTDSEGNGKVTFANDGTYYKEGSNSLKIIFAADALVEDGAQYTTGQPYDWTTDEYVGLWIYSDIALDANDIAFEYTDDGGERIELIGAITVNTWTWVRLTLTVTDNEKDVISELRIVQKVDKGAFNLYVDALTKWDAADATALTNNPLQDGILSVLFQTYANTGTHEQTQKSMYAEWFIDWGASTSYFVPIGDQSAYVANVLYAHE